MPVHAGIGSRDAYTIDLLDGSVYMLMPQQQEGVPLDDGKWVQTFSVLVRPGTGEKTTNLLAALERQLEQARDFVTAETNELNGVWIHQNTATETGGGGATAGGRRALIYDYKLQATVSDATRDPLLSHNDDWLGVLAITRGPWESGLATSPSFPSSVSLYGGTLSLPAGGTLPSRLALFQFRPQQSLNRLWLGMRYDTSGGVFDPVISLGSALDVFDITADCTREASTLFTFARRITFTDPSYGEDMAYRLTALWRMDPLYVVGYHSVLLIARVTDANTVVRVRLSQSWQDPVDGAGSGITTANYLNTLVVNDTAYRVLDAGIMHFPGTLPRTAVLSQIGLSIVRINLEAERLSGTGFLWCGALIFPPAEHRLFLDNIRAVNGDDAVRIFTTEDDLVTVLSDNINTFNVNIPATSPYRWQVPRKGATMVLVGERATGFESLTDTISNVSASMFKRWQRYRDD